MEPPRTLLRLRPILMTAPSIAAGLVPTALGIGAGSAQRSAVAVTIIGGQMLCLLPTLLVTPVAYSLFADAEARSGFALVMRALPRLLGRRGDTSRSQLRYPCRAVRRPCTPRPVPTPAHYDPGEAGENP